MVCISYIGDNFLFFVFLFFLNLQVEIQLMPNLSSSTSEQVLSSQLDYERNRHIESDRLLMNYAKQWWKDFLGIRSSHTNRNVKLFTKDENGDCHMVCLL